MTKDEAIETIKFMNTLYPNRKTSLDNSTIEAWKIMFDGYTSKQVINSIKGLAKRNHRFVPDIPEILDNLENEFVIQTYDLGKFKVVRVVFRDENVGSIPFNFDSVDEANTFIKSLKRKPPKAGDILDMYVANVRNDPKVIGGASYD